MSESEISEIQDSEDGKEIGKNENNIKLGFGNAWPMSIDTEYDKRLWRKSSMLLQKIIVTTFQYVPESISSSFSTRHQEDVCDHDLNELMAALNVQFNEVKTYAEEAEVLIINSQVFKMYTIN